MLDSLVRVSRRVGKNFGDQSLLFVVFVNELTAASLKTEKSFPTGSPTGVPAVPPAAKPSFYRFLLNDFKSFNSLFKVLFIFPSQYLFAIGLPISI
jgi:hypothetical protein